MADILSGISAIFLLTKDSLILMMHEVVNELENKHRVCLITVAAESLRANNLQNWEEAMQNLNLKTLMVTLASIFLLSGFWFSHVEASVPNNSVTSIKVVDESLTGVDIQDGSLTGTDIQDGSVTRSDIQPIARQVVVATSGGDYTSISAALAAITPSATNPYVIDVLPGTYTENVTMKSYVHLRGAGREVTTIQASNTGTPVIGLTSLVDVAISGLTIKGGNYGIANNSSSPSITSNTITGNSLAGILNGSSSSIISGNLIKGNSQRGISNTLSASPTISDNVISENGDTGIVNDSSSSPTIIDNTIANNGVYGILSQFSSSPTIKGNIITGSVSHGLSITASSSPTVIYNRITGNGQGGLQDIFVYVDSTPNISFNIYDDINGATGVGQYNVNSNGDPAPAP